MNHAGPCRTEVEQQARGAKSVSLSFADILRRERRECLDSMYKNVKELCMESATGYGKDCLILDNKHSVYADIFHHECLRTSLEEDGLGIGLTEEGVIISWY